MKLKIFSRVKRYLKLKSKRSLEIKILKAKSQATREEREKQLVIQEEQIFNKYCAQHWLVNPYDVLSEKNGKIYLGNELITDAEVGLLKAEAGQLEGMRLWKVFQETIKQRAIEMAVMNSQNFEQVVAGKMMIHNIGIQKAVVKLMRELANK